MGVLYDYFRAPGEAEVRRWMDENDEASPVPDTSDGIELKSIDPCVILGQLVAFATGQEWTPDLTDERWVWPEDGEQNAGHEGPWVVVLGDGTRDVLAGVPADRMPALAEQWVTIEEFGGDADAEFAHEVVAEFAALASRAREHGESLYCWMSL